MGNNNEYTDDEVYILVDEDGNEVFLDDDLNTGDDLSQNIEAEPEGEPVVGYVTESVAEPEGDTVVYDKYEVEQALGEEVGEVVMEDEYELEEPSYDTGVIDFDEEDNPVEEVFEKSGSNIILLVGALIIVLAAVFVGIFYFTRKAPKESAVDFASVGTEIAAIGVIGEENIAAITSAEGSRLDELYEAQKSYDYDEADQENGISSVNITLTSIVKDLKVKFVNAKGKLIGNVPFTVEVTYPDGKTEKWEDDNKDGIIYKTDLAGGIYKVKIVPLNGYDTMYDFSTATVQSLTVKTQLDYQKVDVKNEIKKSNQVDASEDAAAKETEVESKLKDTVSYVVSAKIPSSEGFKAISKDTVTDPIKTLTAKNEASIGRFKRLSDTTQPGDDTSGNSQETHTEHTWGSWEPDGTDSHKRTCTYEGCGAVETGNCSDIDGDGLCDLCKRTLTVAHTHAYVWKCDEATKTHWQECTLDNCDAKKIDEGTCTEFTYTKVENSFNKHKAVCKTCGHEYALSNAISDCVDNSNPKDNKCDLCGGDIKAETMTVTYDPPAKLELSLTTDKDKEGTLKATAVKEPVSDAAEYKWEAQDKDQKIVELKDVTLQTVKIKALKAGTVNVRCIIKFADGKTVEGSWLPVTVSENVTITFDKAGNEKTGKKVIFVNNEKVNIAAIVKGGTTGKVKWTVSDANICKIDGEPVLQGKEGDAERKASCNIIGLKAGTVTLTCESEDDNKIKQVLTVIVLEDPKNDKTTKLVDNNGKQVYVYDKSAKKYVEATYADYYSGTDLFTPVDITYIYNGWWTIDGKTYYFDASGKKVTGDQVILGAKYSFGSDGALRGGTGLFGIDVSTWNGTIDWKQVAKSGVSYAIIRCGYRGSTLGSLVEDNKFATNIKNASDAGIKVGVYFFTQAVSEAEAVEEASMCLSLVEGYKLTYPIFIDVESGSGNARANGLSKEARTAIVKAFCKTIANGGYKAGIYANRNWLTNKLNTSELTAYSIWLAQYSSAPTYTATRYDLWQYSSEGSIKGISGNVDLDLSYLGY